MTRHFKTTLLSFLTVLLLMPLGHALMVVMEHLLEPTALHYSAFAMGLAGMCLVVTGVFVASDTRATVCGLAGGLLFWTGWVEFLFAYYAWRYGVHCDLLGSGEVMTLTRFADGGMPIAHEFFIDGTSLADISPEALKAMRGSRPEYLVMPATFGLWMMVVMLYLFCTRTGCRFFTWLQKRLGLQRRLQPKPITRLPAMITFLELNVMLWGCYLLLMFCYDPIFLGSRHWVTLLLGAVCLAGAVAMFMRQLRIAAFAPNLRMAIATVIVFWTFIEIAARNGLFKEIWIEPLAHLPQMGLMLAALLAVVGAPLVGRLRNFR